MSGAPPSGKTTNPRRGSRSLSAALRHRGCFKTPSWLRPAARPRCCVARTCRILRIRRRPPFLHRGRSLALGPTERVLKQPLRRTVLRRCLTGPLVLRQRPDPTPGIRGDRCRPSAEEVGQEVVDLAIDHPELAVSGVGHPDRFHRAGPATPEAQPSASGVASGCGPAGS